MKNKPYLLNTLLAAVFTLALLVMVLVRAFAPLVIRVAEAAKMGYTACILPESNRENIKNPKIKLIGVKNVKELFRLLGN